MNSLKKQHPNDPSHHRMKQQVLQNKGTEQREEMNRGKGYHVRKRKTKHKSLIGKCVL